MVSSLNGKVVFISGGSRGIGLAIAKRLAQEGAKIVIAAKTTEPHPSLPGTIYTAADEIRGLGVECLPIMTDIRDENQVSTAINKTVEHFGHLDILVNNASAISLTDTANTPIKRFDLMHQINTRGTYLCTQYALPHLIQSAKAGRSPHVLNMSPPLNLDPKWFGGHVAYTIAKYGMSMCVLGHAEEFRPYHIAVNALWPRTPIYTAAMQMIPGVRPEYCRKAEIVADAAFFILARTAFATGNFYIDEEVLQSADITDLARYALGDEKDLKNDFFV